MTDKTRTDQPTTFLTKHLTIMTFSVNGLFVDNKIQQIFQTLKNKNAHITLLQETHSNSTITKKWQKE